MRIRRVTEDEASRYRETRLRALLDAPDAFGRSHAEEAALPAARWRARLEGATTFVAEDEYGTWLGFVTTAPDPDATGVAGLFGMWVDPAHRGRGVGSALAAAVTGWASGEGLETVRLTVTEGNVPAERLYAREGFRPTGAQVRRERDGRVEIEMDKPVRPA